MKWLKRLSAFLLVLALVLPLGGTFGALTAVADGGQSPGQSGTPSQKRKVVSVVYDDSGSMTANIEDTKPPYPTTLEEEARFYYARYAAQMLIGLLNPLDELFIIPMNDPAFKDEDPKKDGLQVDLNGNRDDTVKTVMETSIFNKVPSGQTPIASIDRAVERLKARGMSNVGKLGQEADTEYWLIILTDGKFGNQTGDILTPKINSLLKEGYYGLRTIYILFGKETGTVDYMSEANKKNLEEFNKLAPFFAYHSVEGIANTMQQVAAKITGRYEVNVPETAVGEKTVTIEIPSSYSVNSVSLVVQDVVVNNLQEVSVSYSGPLLIEQACSIDASGVSAIAGAYSVVLRPTSGTVIQGGTITLSFNEKNFDTEKLKNATITALFEPSIYITPYIQYEGDEEISRGDGESIKKGDIITPEDMNAHLKPGDWISVGYNAYDQRSHKEVILKETFGNNIASALTYAGKENLSVGTAFQVVEGKNEIAVSVVINKGNPNEYSLFGSLFCNIEENPRLFRIEHKAVQDGSNCRVNFTVYVNNTPVGANQLVDEDLIYEITVGTGSGKQIRPSQGVDGATGTAYVEFDVSGPPDTYSAKMVVRSDPNKVEEKDRRYREDVCKVDPGTRVEGKFVEGTGGNDYGRVEFTLFVNNEEDTTEFCSGQWTIRVTHGNDEIQFKQADIGLIASPSSELAYGKYLVEIEIVGDAKTIKGATAFTVAPKTMTVTVANNELTTIRQYALIENPDGMVFALTGDGKNIDFENPIVEYHVFFGDDEVTQYAEATGNELRYVPKADHVRETYRTPGEKKVTVKVTCPGVSVGEATATATFMLEKTAFILEPVNLMQKEVNRFGIEQSNAGLYFRLSRDGIPVHEEELIQFYESGQLQIKLPTALSFFLLPAGVQTGIEVVNGEPLLYCKVVKDQPGIFSVFTSMLQFNGSKTVTVRYLEAEATDAVVFTSSPIWQYVWRILLLLLIIYIIIYIIGFFTQRMIPRGLLVAISVGANNTKSKTDIKKINMSVWDAVLWHIKRFFTGALRNQSPIKTNVGVVSISKTGSLKLTLERYYAKEIHYNGGNPDFDRLLTNLSTKNKASLGGLGLKDEHSKSLSKSAARKLFRDKSVVTIIERGKQLPLTARTYYELFLKLKKPTDQPRSSRIVFYIRRRK